jgi:hypothetical protein
LSKRHFPHNSLYEKYPETGKIQKNLQKPEVLREIRKSPEAGKNPEKIPKSGSFPGNPEGMATLTETMVISYFYMNYIILKN